MSNLGNMEQRISDEMKRGELSAGSSAILDSILSAIAFYGTQRFSWNEFRDETHTTVADDPYMSITATLKIVMIDSVKVVIGSRDYPLDEWPWSSLEAIDSGQWAGYPENYAWYAEQLRFYPIPNDAYTVKLSGVKELTEVSAGAANSATNAWMTDGEEMIRLHAKGTLFRDQLRAPNHARDMFLEAERSRKHAQRRSIKLQGGRVRPMYF